MKDKVKVGIFTYTISEVDGPIVLNGRECDGVVVYDDLKIEILKDRAPMKKLQTLAHEIVHAIVREHYIDLREDNTEKTVDALATGFLQVILDNPNLFNVGQEPEKEEGA